MTIEIKVPPVGESIIEGTLSRWFKKDGDRVQRDEPVFELETEKATSEIPAPASGRLKILVPEGQRIAIGSVVGQVEESAAPDPRGASRTPAVARAPSTGAEPTPIASAPGEAAPASAPPRKRDPLLSPAARKIAAEQGLDPQRIPGTGREGRVTKEDVLNYLEKPGAGPDAPPAPGEPSTRRPAGNGAATATPATPARAPRETREPMSGIRQRIAERLVLSQQSTATLTTFNEADMSAILDLRARYKDRFKEKYGVGLGFMSFFVKAAIEALRQYPNVNARIEGAEIVHPNAYHIGVAVSTEKGLMVPVLRDADHLTFAQIEEQIAALAERARQGKITVADLQGGTFTITNGGIFGSLLSTPILNPPQSGILGMHAVQKRPVASGDQVLVRPMMYLALSYDHRIIDGRDAVRFLVRIKECVEDPERLLLEI